MDIITPKGVKLGSKQNYREVIKDFLVKALDSGIADAAFLPVKVPSGDSYAWMLIRDRKVLEMSDIITPIMPVNAANAVKRLTRKGNGKYRTCVLVRPCEIRALTELIKLNQVHSEDLFLITYDCPGAVPMQDFIKDPEGKGSDFNSAFMSGEYNSDIMKSICGTCTEFGRTSSDMHISETDSDLYLVPVTEKGNSFITDCGLKAEEDMKPAEDSFSAALSVRKEKRTKVFTETAASVDGMQNLNKVFEKCIGCHNCGSVCPICYCRQCFFDSSVNEQNSDYKLLRASKKGALSFPEDKLMFHIGRMTHMSLSCVSCGLCSDACPVDIPVASVFSYMASQTQEAFDYRAGNSTGDPLPMRDYKEEELGQLGQLGELVKSVDRQEGLDA